MSAQDNPQSRLLRLVEGFVTTIRERTEPPQKSRRDLFRFAVTEYKALRSQLLSTTPRFEHVWPGLPFETVTAEYNPNCQEPASQRPRQAPSIPSSQSPDETTAEFQASTERSSTTQQGPEHTSGTRPSQLRIFSFHVHFDQLIVRSSFHVCDSTIDRCRDSRRVGRYGFV
jgi:hypothetical protein